MESMNEYQEEVKHNGVLVFDVGSEGLEPMKHRIISIMTKTANEERVFTHQDEKTILESFWMYVKSGRFDKMIGFNNGNKI